MKKTFKLIGIIALAAVIALALIGCPDSPGSVTQTGTITGYARFSNNSSNAGILVTLEKTNGALSMSAFAAARSADPARSISGARSLAGQVTTGADGKFTFADLEPGFYTVYATSADSKERAVSINRSVAANQTIDDIVLNLTAVGSVSGTINLDEGGNHGYLVGIAGTSYMALTGTNGSFTISDVPVGSSYYIIVTKGLYTDFWHEGAPQTVSVTKGANTTLGTKNIEYEDVINGGITIEIGENGNWYINGKDTGKPAQGPQGPKGDPGYLERVLFNGLTANGDANNTTTKLTLVFDIDIAGFNSNDITIIDHGNTGAVKGPLSRTGTGTYELAVYGIRGEGSVSVVVSKTGFLISPIYKTVTLNKDDSPISSFNSAGDLKLYLDSLPENYNNNPYHIVLYGINLEGSDLWAGGHYLGALYNALTRYVVLDLRDCTGQLIPDSNYSSSSQIIRSNQFRVVSVLLPDTLTSIGIYAFYNCNSLTTIDLPDTLTRIGHGAFYNCSSLTTIDLPDTLTSIENIAFYNCSSLTSISLPDTLTSIEGSVFVGCSSLTTIKLPAALTSIGGFSDCSSLTTIDLPDTITSIDGSAFSGCSSLTTIKLPAALTSIGGSAFSGCSSLTSIDLPDTLTIIDTWAFRNSPLVLVTCNAISPPSLYHGSFEGYHPSMQIKVPSGSVAAYKAAEGWSEYADRITAIE